jgi:predicted nucleic acid-binding Zn ribbon protein
MKKYCLICGNEFETDGHKKTCSPECAKLQKEKMRLRHKKEHPVVRPPKTKYKAICPMCGEAFITTSVLAIYCNDKCKSKAAGRKRFGKSVPEPQPKEVLRESKKNSRLDVVIRSCSRKGITYGEWQRAQTAAMYARVEV